ncbi:MAG TPA: PAS domain-containing protein, partial [Rhizorhapis sp.]|nr:PAS domain-containing protein [Rhizorhapis sp.]
MTSQKLPLGVLMGFSSPADMDVEQLRRSQFRSIDRLGSLYFLLFGFAVIFICGVFAATVSWLLLGGWVLLAVGVGGLYHRGGRARIQADHAGVNASTVLRDGAWMFALGLIWAVPSVLFAHPGNPVELISVWALMSCIMAGTALTYIGLPLSTLLFLTILGGANAYMMMGIGSFQLPAVVVCYALLLIVASLRHARAYSTQVTATTQLQEKSEVVSLLLREFEDSNADWLWQTDAARRVTDVSPRFARALGMDAAEIEGKPLLQLLAGSAWESGQFSRALHELAEKIKRRESFANLVLDVDIGGQRHWWELSASPRVD